MHDIRLTIYDESKSQKEGFTPLETGRIRPLFLTGFTLIELLVSVSIFAMTMLVIASSLLTMVDANRKGQAISTVMNNLDFALESITRNARTGTAYLCGNNAMPTSVSCQSISSGNYFGFTNSSGSQVYFRAINSKIERCTEGGACTTVSTNWYPMTATQVTINTTGPSFYFFGTLPYGVGPTGDYLQPRMVMTIRGTASVAGEQTAFNIQTSVVQRTPDR